MSHVVFDRALLRRHQERAHGLAAAGADFLLRRAAADLGDRLAAVLRRFPSALDLGSGGDAVAATLRRSGKAEAVVQTHGLAAALGGGLAVVADEEALPFGAGSFDLAVSLLALQHVNDLPGTLVQVRRALKPDGLFVAALLGGGTLHELRECFAAAEAEIEGGASPHVAPFLDVRDAGALLQRAGFALPVADSDTVRVRYATAFGLMADLRAMGAANALVERPRRPLRRATLLRMAELYARRHADPDGRVRATFEFVWMSGWAPHESQPRPLKPGSARMRLADALHTEERPAGEKPGGG